MRNINTRVEELRRLYLGRSTLDDPIFHRRWTKPGNCQTGLVGGCDNAKVKSKCRHNLGVLYGPTRIIRAVFFFIKYIRDTVSKVCLN
ncbi:hypothetical protein IX307_002003 [Bacteroides pyogenes]|nr:hypothetical protein [Bacteroides pyogenes]MBR8709258.1 hypothetical protein [Bacteroides pyogenes]MBR8718116.1 hypothetical protein [Bacteroides pyogenes]MBR8720829.1 hypothetical protein [Bacteroides pyogenes]MBR8724717.1 hypothetical protein [Bacteroides pyogenes]